ncbi:MAG TPA: SHOCT domain-containing protein [Rhizomicrobium sp.]|nr:SHOCT domain-containing protein [Rhizomicrobium sp.]
MVHALLFWPFFFWWPLHGLLSLIVIVVVLSLIFGRGRHYYYPTPQDGRSGARAILEERYARGEIQRDEYLQKKQDLGG